VSANYTFCSAYFILGHEKTAVVLYARNNNDFKAEWKTIVTTNDFHGC